MIIYVFIDIFNFKKYIKEFLKNNCLFSFFVNLVIYEIRLVFDFIVIVIVILIVIFIYVFIFIFRKCCVFKFDKKYEL